VVVDSIVTSNLAKKRPPENAWCDCYNDITPPALGGTLKRHEKT